MFDFSKLSPAKWRRPFSKAAPVGMSGYASPSLASNAGRVAPSLKWVALAALAAILMESVGFGMLPIKAWLTSSHELFHAMAGWLTGGVVESIQADGEHGGVTYTRGGIYPIISCAGYLGCGGFGALCLRYSGRPAMRAAFMAFCVALPLALLVKGRFIQGGYGVGMAEALAVDALALWAARSRWSQFVLALSGCLFLSMGLDDLRVLLVYATDQTDAGLLARWMGLPFLAWPIALAYAGAMLAMWFWAFRGLARDMRGSPR